MAEKEEDEKKDEMKSQEEELEEYFAEDDESKNEKVLTKEDVIAIVRDELKTFWKGVMAGKYPLPKYPYAKKSLTIEGEEGILGEEGIVIPITIKPIVAEEKSMKTDEDEGKDKEEKEDEKKNEGKEKEEDKGEEKKTGDNTKEEQEKQITELQKTIEDMKKELETLKAKPQKEEDGEKSAKKEIYRSEISVENGRISRQ